MRSSACFVLALTSQLTLACERSSRASDQLANSGRVASTHVANTRFGVEFEVPFGWQVYDPGPGGGDEGAAGPNGYVKLTALGGPRSLAEACETEAGHRTLPYGPKPRVEMMIKVAGQFGCRITPTVPGAVKRRIPAGLITYYDPPLVIEPRDRHPRTYDYLVVWVDPPHLALIESTLRFRSYRHG